jgi:hypothetical protein
MKFNSQARKAATAFDLFSRQAAKNGFYFILNSISLRLCEIKIQKVVATLRSLFSGSLI